MTKAIKNLHLISLTQGWGNIIEQQLSVMGGLANSYLIIFLNTIQTKNNYSFI